MEKYTHTWTGAELLECIKPGGMVDMHVVDTAIDALMRGKGHNKYRDEGKRFVCPIRAAAFTDFNNPNYVCKTKTVEDFKTRIGKFDPEIAKLVSFS